jgi:hypothetical protein
MYSLKVVPPLSSRKCGNTSSRTTRSIWSAGSCWKFDHRRCCCLAEKTRFHSFLVRAAIFSLRASLTSRSRANMRNEICSITVSGLVMPPVQNSVHSWSMSRLICGRLLMTSFS